MAGWQIAKRGRIRDFGVKNFVSANLLLRQLIASLACAIDGSVCKIFAAISTAPLLIPRPV
jgi:hypothetical protein